MDIIGGFILAMLYFGGVKLCIDQKSKMLTAYFWPWHLGKHLAYYTFAFKTMAESYREQEAKRRLH